MSSESTALTLSIDTAAAVGSVALFEGRSLLNALTWRSRQNQSRELLPNLETLLLAANREKGELEAVFVCLGPGSYAGLRVGLSTAKALAFGLGCQIVGIGRLQADAFPFLATGHRIFAIHAAGRAELAWAAYSDGGISGPSEDIAPRLGTAEALAEQLEPGDLVCGERQTLPDLLVSRGARLVSAPAARFEAIADLGWLRLSQSPADDLKELVPLYLRAPAIGPQPPKN